MNMAYVCDVCVCVRCVGISSDTVVRPSSVSQEELLELIDKMNRDWRVSGLLVQLPLPGKHGATAADELSSLTSKITNIN